MSATPFSTVSVKSGKARLEYLLSAYHPIATIQGTSRIGSFVPIAEIQFAPTPTHHKMVWSQPGFIPLALITAMADGLIRYATNALAASRSLLLAATPTA